MHAEPVLRSFGTCHPERCALAAHFDSARPAVDLDHSVWSVLCTVFRHYFKIRSLAASLGCRLSALGVDHAAQGVLFAAVLGFLSRNSKFVIFPKPLTLHFVLLEKLTFRSLTCCPQHYPVVLWRLMENL